MANEFIIKNGFHSKGDSQLTGSLNVSSTLTVGGSAVGAAFPFSGSAVITGSLLVSGSGQAFRMDSDDVVLGHLAGQDLDSNTSYNVLIGREAGKSLTTGDYNVGIGAQAIRLINDGVGNTAAGYRAGEEIDLGNYNIVLGYYAGYSIEAGSNNIVIGSGSLGNVDMSNQLRIGSGMDITTISGSLSTGDVHIYNTASAAVFSGSTYYGDGSNLTGISSTPFPFTGDAQITGSLIISASATSQSLSVIGSGSTVFDVIGSEGTLFSVDDDLSGMLFTTNDISGLPVLQASASGELYLGKSPQSLYPTAVISATSASSTASVYALSTSSYDGAFFDYTITSASNAHAGSIMSIWNGENINYTDTATTAIGSTAGIDLQVIISASQAQLIAITDSTAPNTWKVKTIVRSI